MNCFLCRDGHDARDGAWCIQWHGRNGRWIWYARSFQPSIYARWRCSRNCRWPRGAFPSRRSTKALPCRRKWLDGGTLVIHITIQPFFFIAQQERLGGQSTGIGMRVYSSYSTNEVLRYIALIGRPTEWVSKKNIIKSTESSCEVQESSA